MAIVNAGNARTLSAHPADHTNYSAMAMVTTLFFAWGFCTVLNVLLFRIFSLFLI